MGVVHNSMMMDWKTISTIIIIGLGLLLFMFETVNSACQEYYVDDLGPNDKRIFTLGETATLKCNVSAEKATDQIYWKFENHVLSERNTVGNNFKDKFNVRLKDQIYTLSWIVQLDDSGKYNCTCTNGGIQFPVWVKRPCNNRTLHITDTSSTEIVNFNKTTPLQPKELAMCTSSKTAEVLNLTFDLDCKCTWPETNRNFTGHWYKTCSNTNLACKDGAYKGTLPAPVGHQDMSNQPIGCFAGGDSTTYRYQNVTGQLKTNISCSSDSMINHTFALYIKESLLDKPDKSYKVLMAIKCPACPNKCINGKYKRQNCTDARNINMEVGEAMFVMNIRPNECKNSSVHYNDTKVDGTECCECIMKINCTKEGTIQPRYMNKEVVNVTCVKGAPTTSTSTTGAPTTSTSTTGAPTTSYSTTGAPTTSTSTTGAPTTSTSTTGAPTTSTSTTGAPITKTPTTGTPTTKTPTTPAPITKTPTTPAPPCKGFCQCWTSWCILIFVVWLLGIPTIIIGTVVHCNSEMARESTCWNCFLIIIVLVSLHVIGIIIVIVFVYYNFHRGMRVRRRIAPAHYNPTCMTSQNSLGTTLETLPPRERQPGREPDHPNSKDGKAENGLSADKYAVEDTVNPEKKQTTLPPRERQPGREPDHPNSRDSKVKNGIPVDKSVVEDTAVATELELVCSTSPCAYELVYA